MKKETWIQDVLESSKGVKSAMANPFTTTRVLANLTEEQTQIKRWQLSLSVACLLLVLFSVIQINQNDISIDFENDTKTSYSVNYSQLYPY